MGVLGGPFCLPPDLFFPTFFQLAEAGGLATSTARRCRMHSPLAELLVQSGASLEKTGGVKSDG